MAAFDFDGIRTQIKTQLLADSNLTKISVLIEEELTFQENKTVIIYLESAFEDAERQTASSGKRSLFTLRFAIQCFAVSLDYNEAIKQRDKLVGDVHIALITDRTLSGKVQHLWFDTFLMATGNRDGTSGFVSGTEIQMLADVLASV